MTDHTAALREAFETHIRQTWKVPADYLDWALTMKDGQYQDSRAADQFSGWCAALAQPQQPAGWRPIETAPKDGRTLLLGYFNSHGKWRTLRGEWMSEDYIAEYWDDPDDVEPGWFETSVEADDPPNCWRVAPTHWMPLPSPPTAHPSQQEDMSAYKRMFEAAIRDLAAISEHLGLDPDDDGGAEPIIYAIDELRAKQQEDDARSSDDA